MHRVYLSRRNISTLISKLDRVKAGDFSACTIYKCDNEHAKYPQTMEQVAVSAVEEIGNYVSSPEQIFLTRANLDELIRTIDVKHDTTYGNLRVGGVDVLPLEDAEYYDTREPGFVHPLDTPNR